MFGKHQQEFVIKANELINAIPDLVAGLHATRRLGAITSAAFDYGTIGEPDLIGASFERTHHPGLLPALSEHVRMPILFGTHHVLHLHNHNDGARFVGSTKRADISQTILLPHGLELIECRLKLGEIRHTLLHDHIILHENLLVSFHFQARTTVIYAIAFLAPVPSV